MAQPLKTNEPLSSDSEDEGFVLTERNKKMKAESTDREGCLLCLAPREQAWRADILPPFGMRHLPILRLFRRNLIMIFYLEC